LLAAGLCAVECGRWLALKHLATMSTDPSGAALARFAPAAEPSTRIAALSHRDLADLADVIVRIEGVLKAAPVANGSDVIERIADIAFVLHERDIEASLCDALDTAVREISAADALRQASAHRAHQAAELLRALSLRLNEIIARAESGPQRNADKSVAQPAEGSRDGSPITEVAIERPVGDGESSVAAQAGSPRSPEPPPLDPEDDPDDLFEPVPAVSISARPKPEAEAAVPSPSPPSTSEKVGEAATPPSEKTNPLALIPRHSGGASDEGPLQHRSQAARRERTAMPPARAESSGAVSSVGAATPPVTPLAHIAAASLPQSLPGPAPIDPLAPVYALSEEELIALFS
jgi:hypothetical protein